MVWPMIGIGKSWHCWQQLIGDSHQMRQKRDHWLECQHEGYQLLGIVCGDCKFYRYLDPASWQPSIYPCSRTQACSLLSVAHLPLVLRIPSLPFGPWCRKLWRHLSLARLPKPNHLGGTQSRWLRNLLGILQGKRLTEHCGNSKYCLKKLTPCSHSEVRSSHL